MNKKKKFKLNIFREAAYLWNAVCAMTDAPDIMMPPVKIDNENTEKVKANNNVSFRVAEINSSWYDDGYMLECCDYELRFYPESFKRYIDVVFKKHPPAAAVRMILNHAIIHEYCHYIRNHNSWMKLHKKYKNLEDEDNINRTRNKLMKYIVLSGKEKDEYETEQITMSILADLYEINTELKPVFSGSFAKFMEKRKPGYTCSLAVYNMLDMEFHATYEDNETKKDRFINAWEFCINYLTDVGKEENIEVELRSDLYET